MTCGVIDVRYGRLLLAARSARGRPAGEAAVRRGGRWSPWLLAAAAFAVYVTYSLTRFRTGHAAAYDLGIFVQVVSRYAHLQAPDIGVKLGWNALGDHFSPALALLAPFYRLVPRAETLLVAQALLAAVSVVPVTRVAQGILGRRPGQLVGLAYAGSYGLQSLIGFDFHEVSLAVPLLAFGLEAYLGGHLHRAAVLIGLTVFVKEDLGLTVLLFAVVLALRGERRLAAAVGAWAVAWFLLAIEVIVPALSPDGTYRYLHHFEQRSSLSPHRLATMVIGDGRIHLLWLLLLIGSAVVVRSPLVLLTIGTLSWRLASTGPGYMGTHAHYDAVLMPIVFLASLDGLRRIGRPALDVIYPWLSVAVMVAVTVAAYPLPQLLHPAFYRARPEVAEVQRLVRHVPPGAGLRTDNNLAPLVITRNDVSMLYATLPNVPVERWLLVELHGCSLNAPLRWTIDYVRALQPYAVASWRDGAVELLELGPGAPSGVPDPYPPC
jgi:uncharacterized membrane protein